MNQEDSDGTVRIFSARACAAPFEKKKSPKQFGNQQLWWRSAAGILKFPFNNKGSFLRPFHSLYFLNITRI